MKEKQSKPSSLFTLLVALVSFGSMIVLAVVLFTASGAGEKASEARVFGGSRHSAPRRWGFV